MIRRCAISLAMSMNFQNRTESDSLRMITNGTIIAQKITIKIAGRLMFVKGIFPRNLIDLTVANKILTCNHKRNVF